MLKARRVAHQVGRPGIIGRTVLGGYEVRHCLADPIVFSTPDDALGPRQVVVKETAVQEAAADGLEVQQSFRLVERAQLGWETWNMRMPML